VTWSVEVDKKAIKELTKLDKPIQTRIINELTRISLSDNPKQFGKGLTANLIGLWRFRVGDYRIICEITDSKLKILVVRIAHRRNAYED
jgi:mRNA interferase RelE/StbE